MTVNLCYIIAVLQLLVVTVSLEKSSVVFSHQVGIVRSLMPFFSSTTVLTRSPLINLPHDFQKVIVVPWAKFKPFTNSVKLIASVLPFLLRNRNIVVFTHMSDSMAAILSPLTWILGIRHFLWYAHTSNSTYLRFSRYFLSGIITSTPGSCPIRGKKVFPVGQGIDEKIFQSNVVPKLDAKNVSFFNYGRLDSSKRADLLVLVVSQLRRESTNFKLTFYGQTLENSPQWLTKIHELQSDLNLRPWLNFDLPLEQNEIRDALLKHDIFIHAFHGSLDKTLIETTMMQKPVITCNEEYLEIFGSWSGLDKSQIDDLNFLIFEVKTLLSLSKNHVAEEIVRRYQMAITNHSLSSWAVAVSHILTGTGQLA